MTRRLCLAGLSLCLLLLTGCWDLREMNHLALVMAVGIDKADQPGRVQVTVQIARPSGQGRSGNASSGGGQGPPVYIATADGDTIFSAIRNLAQFTSRRVMWAHNNVVVIGEALAKDDITPVIDFFTRNQELRMRTWIVVARGSDARALVSAPTGMEDIPANSISALLRYAQLPGESVRADVSEVASMFFDHDLHPVMPAMRLKRRALKPTENPEHETPLPQVELAGTAIFHRTHLVGYVERETGRGLLWLRRQMKNAVMSTPCPGSPDAHLAVEIRSPSVTIQSDVRGAVPAFTVQVNTEGWISEQGCPTATQRASVLKQYVETVLARKIETEMKGTLARLQGEYATDGVRFARIVHVQHPAWWRTNVRHWDDLFARAKVRYSVTVHIPKMGLYTRPTRAISP